MYYHPHFTDVKKTDETECSKYIKVKIINKLAKTCTSRALLRNTYIINSFSNTYCREQNNLLSRPPSSCSAIHWFLFHKKSHKNFLKFPLLYLYIHRAPCSQTWFPFLLLSMIYSFLYLHTTHHSLHFLSFLQHHHVFLLYSSFSVSNI